jgi:hypothetical protein
MAGQAAYLQDVAWARALAEEVLGGPWLAWTSGSIMGRTRQMMSGRIFVGTDRFCFIADGADQTLDRLKVLVYEDLLPVEGVFKRFVPNAFVSFGPLVFMGVKDPMRTLYGQCRKVQAANCD